MINKTVKRWINEYLDGEIGLADKVELERIMSENPEVREEYMRLRKLGLLLSSMPEVSVHPSRFRQNLYGAMEQKEAVFFTPQRAFSAAMLVAVIVVGLTFGLFMYQQKILQNPLTINATNVDSVAADLSESMALNLGVSAEVFFNRLLIESQMGMTDKSLLSVFITEGVYDGAVCVPGGGLNSTRFRTPLASTTARIRRRGPPASR